MIEFIKFAHDLADIGGEMMRSSQLNDIELKPDKSFVTNLDKEIEAVLREKIMKHFPSHGIIGEEWGNHQEQAELVWVLDPIDGTAPFIAGVPVYGSLVALTAEEKPILGILDQPATHERWLGVKGEATLFNGKVARVKPCEALSNAILTTSNPDFYEPHELPAFNALKVKTAWRIYGGCCRAYGLLASGRTDIAMDTGFKIFDYMPFVPIIEGAGGVISDWQGKPLTLNSGKTVLAAGQKHLHNEALALIKDALS